MEASAKGAKEAGGVTIGVLTSSLMDRPANAWIDTVLHEQKLVDRMMKLVELGDAYVVLKGGTGTLLELAAVWEFMNKNIIGRKPILIVGDFWKGVVATLNEELAWEGLENCTRFVMGAESPIDCGIMIQQLLREGY